MDKEEYRNYIYYLKKLDNELIEKSEMMKKWLSKGDITLANQNKAIILIILETMEYISNLDDVLKESYKECVFVKEVKKSITDF